MKIGQIEQNSKPITDHWRRKYPFDKMNIGDSILIEGSEEDVHRACVAVHNYGTRHKRKFTYRKSNDKKSVRIYRINLTLSNDWCVFE